jgi:hypothetical protein
MGSDMAEQDEAIEAIAGTWFWVAAAFFLVIQFGDWIRVHWALGLLIAAGLALVNVVVFFGQVWFLSSKLNLRSNLFVTAVELLIANIATLAVAGLFMPTNFKGPGDFLLGALGMVVLVGAARSIGSLVRLPFND